MKFLILFVLSAALVTLAPMAAMADCYHGCINKAISINDGIMITSAAIEAECTLCTEGDSCEYTIDIYDACGGDPTSSGTFCTTDPNIPMNTWLFVQSIGAGCSGTPNGCVRLCDCP